MQFASHPLEDDPSVIPAVVMAFMTDLETIQAQAREPRGRSAHRAWIEHVFAPWLPAHGSPDREALVMALYAATDVMQWKLLRRDFDYTPGVTEQIIRRLVAGVICTIDRDQEDNS